jgi:hypothetical protein
VLWIASDFMTRTMWMGYASEVTRIASMGFTYQMAHTTVDGLHYAFDSHIDYGLGP